MEQAFLQRDAAYDGVFFVGVRTTGIFCRPSCPARKPKLDNVEYFPTAREAVFSGYRPCKRCEPLLTHGERPEWLARLLEHVDRTPEERLTDADVRGFGIDPARVRRYFMKHYGMTFHAYCRSRRMGLALQRIRRGDDLDDVILGHGYESHSGFRDAFVRTFGQPPGASRDAGCAVASWIESPIGPLVAAATENGVCLLEFTDRRMLEAQFTTLRRLFSRTVVPGENEHLASLRAELGRYFAGDLRVFSTPLVYPGTPFQTRVWEQLLHIPYGETRSYEDIAVAIGHPKAVRAVGAANGMNRLAIVIPCHRVVDKDGQLGGYGGGLWRKRLLLGLEQGEGILSVNG
jgi:AraC family transcriptional regulator of adaptative response/methylated-DNA-[protein]-cysteine methyltransferase